MSETYIDAYVRLISQARPWRHLPWALKARIGTRLGREGSFLQLRKGAIESAMQDRLGVSAQDARGYFIRLCESTGVAVQMVWHLPKVTDGWIRRNVRLAAMAPLEALRSTGGLVVSHHSFHQNLLPVSLRAWGLRSYPVASSPAAFSSAAFGAHGFLQEFTHYLDRATVAQLGGGHALYLDKGRAFFREVREVMAQRQVVFVCCDFDEPRPDAEAFPFLGRSLRPPSGLMRMALDAAMPVYFAGLVWDGELGCYRLALRLLPGGDLPGLVGAYVEALQNLVAVSPWAWQGWESAADGMDA